MVYFFSIYYFKVKKQGLECLFIVKGFQSLFAKAKKRLTGRHFNKKILDRSKQTYAHLGFQTVKPVISIFIDWGVWTKHRTC